MMALWLLARHPSGGGSDIHVHNKGAALIGFRPKPQLACEPRALRCGQATALLLLADKDLDESDICIDWPYLQSHPKSWTRTLIQIFHHDGRQAETTYEAEMSPSRSSQGPSKRIASLGGSIE